MKYTIEVEIGTETDFNATIIDCCDEVMSIIDRDTCDIDVTFSIVGKNEQKEIYREEFSEEDIEKE